MQPVRRAAAPGQVGRPRRDRDVDAVLLPRELLHRQGDGGVADAEDGVDPFLVVPAAGDPHPDVGAVLQIAEDQLDRAAQHPAAEILDGHARGDDIAHALLVREGAGHVVEHPDLDHIIGGLGEGAPGGPDGCGGKPAAGQHHRPASSS